MMVREASSADRAAWDAYVAVDPEADVLQAWAWGEAWRPEGELPRRLMIVDDGGRIRALAQALVRATTGGRSIVYVPHGPLWDRRSPGSAEDFAAIIDGLATTARTVRAIVVKIDPRSAAAPDADEIAALAARHGLGRARRELQAQTTRIVDLRDGGAELAATWTKDGRNRVRRAAREGVTTTIDRAADATSISAFTDILAETSQREGFTARSPAFLTRLASELARHGGWYLTLARQADRAIAGVVTARVGDRAYYLYGASLRDSSLRHLFGSDAAMAAAMSALASDGVKTLDMWGVAEPDDPAADPAWEGFSLFKRRFGGAPVRHPGTFDLVIDRPLYVLRDARERLASLRSGWR
ncbi:MAG TPA: peptidoglycan bridge formation glycyltransferase FemA/FemB family protein [Candidatus Limnocylindrales bacterium]|nr:peptidoglycan bridge formation glycyltransferase FemA/FemB family protein [Candidatus Limnocylindrales bacterium]